MNDSVHSIAGDTAVKIAGSIEEGVRGGRIAAGERLPTVRSLAATLCVSPATVAAAYRTLQSRGILISDGRRGTRVGHRPLARRPALTCLKRGTRILNDGNPDLALLPSMATALASIDSSSCLYGEPPHDAGLVKLVSAEFKDCGVAAREIAFVNGAVDGIERVLAQTLRPGDRVGVEDPSFGNILDLVTSRGLSLVPIRVDSEGLIPAELARACERRLDALIVTPRVQNPTGAALTPTRSAALRSVLKEHSDVLVIEDDHAALITDVPYYPLYVHQQRWVHLRSFSKGLNPDLRLAAITGDDDTITRVLDRMIIGERWVSHIVQRIACAMLSDSKIRAQLRTAAQTYRARREGLVRALHERGISAVVPSGYNVWIPVPEETVTVQELAAAGWAVVPGERFRIHSPPAIRVTAATLEPDESARFADTLTAIIARKGRRTPTP